MTDMTAPERIWLNTAGCYDEAHGHADEMGVTWCEHPQDDDDQEYIRADLGSFYQEKDIDAMQDRIEALEAENARLRAAAEAMVSFHNGPLSARRPDVFQRLMVRLAAALEAPK